MSLLDEYEIVKAKLVDKLFRARINYPYTQQYYLDSNINEWQSVTN